MTLPALTSNERHEAAQRIFLIIEKARKSKEQEANGSLSFVELETELSIELKTRWKTEYTGALTEIFNMLPAELTQEAMELLERELLNALGPAFGMSAAVRRQMKKYIGDAYSNAKQEWTVETPKDKDSPLLSLPDRRAIEVLTRHNCFWLGEHYGEHIGPKISELTRNALDTGIGRKALAEDLKRELGGVAPEDYKYWDVASSAALVRARSFGTISGMEEAGITEYEILAMMDERMCPICGEMNGRVFSVAETRKVIDSALGLDDPKAFKAAMPWQTKPAIGVSSAKLASSGQGIPPFHGRCRCTLIVVSESAVITKESFPGVAPEQVKTIDADTRIAKILEKKGGRSPAVGLPHWKYEIIHSSGTVGPWRFFDGDGNPTLDIDSTDHGDVKNHPYVPHSHDWIEGKRVKTPRKLKKWEKEMMEELMNAVKITKSETKEESSQGVHFATLEDFMHDIEYGGETQIEYGGHNYFITGLYSAWEMLNRPDQNYGEYKSVDEMLDNFRVHTGETLREIATKFSVVSCHSDAKLIDEDGREVP
jgi:SPP1 gp7 family putative phage head morphogenesis protein